MQEFIDSLQKLFKGHPDVAVSLDSIEKDLEGAFVLHRNNRVMRNKIVSDLIVQKVILLHGYTDARPSEVAKSLEKYVHELVYSDEDYYLEFAKVFFNGKKLDALLVCLKQYFDEVNTFTVNPMAVRFWYNALLVLRSGFSLKGKIQSNQIALEQLILQLEKGFPDRLSISENKYIATAKRCIKDYPTYAFGYYYVGFSHFRKDEYDLAAKYLRLSLQQGFSAYAAYYYTLCWWELKSPIVPFSFGENLPSEIVNLAYIIRAKRKSPELKNKHYKRTYYKLMYKFYKCAWDNYSLYFYKDTFLSKHMYKMLDWMMCGEDIAKICLELKWYKRALYYVDISLDMGDYFPMHQLKLECLIALEDFDQVVQYYDNYFESEHPYEIEELSKLYLKSFYLKAKLCKGVITNLYSEAEHALKIINEKTIPISKVEEIGDTSLDDLGFSQEALIKEIELTRTTLQDILKAVPNN